MTENVHHFIEIRGVYDGWSIAVLNDGTYVNRWEPGDRRYAPTQEYIEALEAKDALEALVEPGEG